MNNAEIVRKIKSALESNGMSLRNLAKRAGVASSSLSRYLNLQREMPLSLIDKISDILEIPKLYLMGLEVDTELHSMPVYSAVNNMNVLDDSNIVEHIYISSRFTEDYENIIGLLIEDDVHEDIKKNSIALINRKRKINKQDQYAYIEDNQFHIEKLNEDIILFPFGNSNKNNKHNRIILGKLVGTYNKL